MYKKMVSFIQKIYSGVILTTRPEPETDEHTINIELANSEFTKALDSLLTQIKQVENKLRGQI